MSILRTFFIFALSLVLFTVVEAQAERVVLEYPPGHYLGCCTREVDGVGPWHYSPHIPAAACTNRFDFWDSAWYLNAGAFGGYEELAEKTLPAGSQAELERQPAQVDTAFQGGGGALFRLTDHVALDVGLFGGSGNVTQTALGPRGTVAFSSTAHLRYIGGGLAARFFPAGTSSRLQPWLLAGARGIVVLPQSGSQTVEDRQLSVDKRALSSAGATDLTSGLGLNVRLNPRLDLAVSSDYGFRTGWRASLGIVLPVARRRPAAGAVEFENPFDFAGALHNRGLDHVLGDIQKAAAAEPRKHTPAELLVLVELSLRGYLREENLASAGDDPVAEAKMRVERGERLTLDSVLPSVSVPQRDYARQAVRLLEEAPETGELRPSFDRLAARALTELGPTDSPKLLASLSIAGNSAEYWRRNRLAWSEAVREYLGVPLPEPPEPAGLRWFKWGEVGAVDLLGAIAGGISTHSVGGAVIGGLVSSAFDVAEQLLNHWIFGRVALAPPLGCILRGGRFCDQNGFGCLVMFPEDQWLSMRNVYPGAFELDGQAQVRLGERPSLHYVFRTAPAQELKSLPVNMDVSLDRSVAASLGFKNVIILQGLYEVDRSIGRFGGVVFDVRVDNAASDGPPIANPSNSQDDFGRIPVSCAHGSLSSTGQKFRPLPGAERRLGERPRGYQPFIGAFPQEDI